MDESTEGVTLYAAFVLDLASMYTPLGPIADPLKKMVAGLDPNQPRAFIPMTLYNETCAWIERTFGEASLRDAGRRIGERSYRTILERTGQPSMRPNDVLKELARSARLSIRDPKGRGWEILADQPRRVVMRRTQTFHCVLQEGLLLSLVEKTGALRPRITQTTCTRHDEEFCDYAITWIADAR